MMKRCAGGKSRAGIVLLITALLCFAYRGPALADSSTPIDITVTGGGYTGYLTIDPGTYNPTYWEQVFSSDSPIPWNSKDYPILAGGIDIVAENHEEITLAHLDMVTVAFQGDPVATVGFAVTAGAYATSFSFSSPLITFDPLSNTEAYAEAGIMVTGPTGRTLYGSYTGGMAYKALYNNTTIFSYLVNTPITSYSGGNTGASQALPGTITSIQSKFQFILSAGATASGSSYYDVETVIPEPASMLLLGLGGLALLRKRRA
jgi:hypothetical protein